MRLEEEVSVRAKRSAVAIAAAVTLLVAAIVLPGAALAQEPGCVPTSGRTIGPNGFPGLGVKHVAPVYTDPVQFVAWGLGMRGGAGQREASALIAEGFVSGTSQHYVGRKRKTRGDEGLAFTRQFASPDGATADLHRILADVFKVGPWKRFTVPSIPGSVGVRTKYKGTGASNLYFADGTYFYGLGRYVNRGGTGAGQVTKAALGLYARVHDAAVCT
jgi:hypothetical protein